MRDFAIFILCHRGDFHLTKILCQSIRYFCGQIPIVLIKDGDFSIAQLAKLGNIRELEARSYPEPLRHVRGWGLTRFKAFFQSEYERFLCLDSDVALVGDVLGLPYMPTDFFVDTSGMKPIEGGGSAGASPVEWTERGSFPAWAETYTFNIDKISALDPDFSLDDLMLFNSGQIFGRTGLLPLELVLECAERCQRQDGTFSLYDQGILNYVLNKGHQEGLFRLDGARFRIAGGYQGSADFPDLTRESLLGRTFASRALIHWAGVKHHRLHKFPFAFVLQEFQDQYYAHLPPGSRLVDESRRAASFLFQQIRSRAYKLKRKFKAA